MKFLNDSMPWATIMTAILVSIAAIAGAVVVIRNPDSLSFQQYLDILKSFAIAVGIVGIGRGIASYGKQSAAATMLADPNLVQPTVPAAAPAATGVLDPADLLALASGNAQDPYADAAWPEAAPPPPAAAQPVAAGNGVGGEL
jgi:hypothetical protein